MEVKKHWFILSLLFVGVSGILGVRILYLLIFVYPIIFHKTNIIRHIDSHFWILVLFSLSFTFIWLYNTSFQPSSILIYVFYPPLFYLLGGYFVEKSSSLNSIVNVLIVLIIAYSIIYLRNGVYDTITYGLINPLRSISVNIDSIEGAYFQQVRASLAIAGIGLLFVPTKSSKEKTIKNIFLLLSFVALFVTIHFVNRTGMLLALLSILAVSFKLIKKKSAMLLMSLTGVFILISLNYLLDLVIVQEFIGSYQSRELNSLSSSSTFGGRTFRWVWVLKSLITQPWGDISSFEYGYAHNMWLDAGRLSGIIPFVFLVVFTVSSTIKAVKLVLSKHIPLFFSCLLITLNLTFFLQSFIEPILESDPTFFLLYVLFLSIQINLYKVLNNNSKIQ